MFNVQKTPIEIRKEILDTDLQMWDNTRYMWTIRLESTLRLVKFGLESETTIEPIKKELEKCEAQIKFYQEKIEGLKTD